MSDDKKVEQHIYLTKNKEESFELFSQEVIGRMGEEYIDVLMSGGVGSLVSEDEESLILLRDDIFNFNNNKQELEIYKNRFEKNPFTSLMFTHLVLSVSVLAKNDKEVLLEDLNDAVQSNSITLLQAKEELFADLINRNELFLFIFEMYADDDIFIRDLIIVLLEYFEGNHQWKFLPFRKSVLGAIDVTNEEYKSLKYIMFVLNSHCVDLVENAIYYHQLKENIITEKPKKTVDLTTNIFHSIRNKMMDLNKT